jgi:hypothetical protein
MTDIPEDFIPQPLADHEKAVVRATCNNCGRSWDDGVSTARTPTPAGRCPFEEFHDDHEQESFFRIEGSVERLTATVVCEVQDESPADRLAVYRLVRKELDALIEGMLKEHRELRDDA